jgi:mRNA interferase RelE/StbE
MEVEFEIKYEYAVVTDDIPSLPKVWKKRIRTSIESKLTVAPEVYGKPLRRSLKGYRKLRVGDYRVIFRIADARVLIFAIQHRSVVYVNALKRIR